MPTAADLQRLQALLGRLTPLTNMQRGTLVRSEDWNTVVGAVAELARAVLATEVTAVVPDHDHADQVNVTWLDPRLRSLVERGPLADPAVVGRVTGLEARVGRVAAEAGQKASRVDDLRVRLDELETRDLLRQKDVTAVRRIVEGQADSRDDVATVRETLRSVETDLKRVIEISDRLVVDGEPIDVAGIAGRVSELEQLRERLRTPSGELLDAVTLESRLTELTNTLVTETELDEALKSVRGRVPPDVLSELEERVKAAVTTDVTTRLDAVAEDVKRDVADRLTAIDARVGEAVQAAVPGVRDQVLAAVRPEVNEAVKAGVVQAALDTDRKVAQARTELRTEVDARFAASDERIAQTIGAEIGRQLPAQLAPLQNSVVTLFQRVDQAETRLANHDRDIANQGTRMEVVVRDEAAARTRLEVSLKAAFEDRAKAVNDQMESRITALDAASRTRLDDAVDVLRRSLEERVQKIAVEAAVTEVRHATAELRPELQAIARRESVAVREDLVVVVDQAVKAVESRVVEAVPVTVRRQFELLQPEIRKSVDAAVDKRMGPR